jgi:hypothetical protein
VLLLMVSAEVMILDVVALREANAPRYKAKALIAGGMCQIIMAFAVASILDVWTVAERSVNV